MKTDKIKSAIGQLIDGYLELHRTGYGMVNVNTVLEDLEGLVAIIDSEEDETVTDCNALKEEVISYFQGYWPGIETEEQCNTDMHFTPLAIMRLAEHFAKWGAEHLKK